MSERRPKKTVWMVSFYDSVYAVCSTRKIAQNIVKADGRFLDDRSISEVELDRYYPDGDLEPGNE